MSASRPPALRVPVTDVVTRTSLVTPIPARGGAGDVPPGLAVVQRPVRIISDAPPPASPRVAPVPSEPTVTFESMTPLDRSEISGVQETAGEDYAAVEVEPIEQLELADALEGPEPALATSSDPPFDGDEDDLSELETAATPDEPEPDIEAVDPVLDTAEEEESEIEVSVPPPAPPEALRRSASNEPPADDEEDRRPSGDFEELEVEAEERAADAVPRSMAPPPPPRGRISLPDAPDLTALTRAARVQELRPTRPRQHAWWEIFFDDDYLRTVRPPTRAQIARQCDFIEKRLGLKPGATLLDVGCGLGLHVLEMASRGYLGVGLDLSLPMLSRASEEAQSRSLRVNFLHSDMREMSFDGAFDAVLCMGTSIGYFDEETNRKIIERLHRALKPGGVLLLDVVNRDHVIRSQPNLIWFEGEGCVCMEESEFNFFTSRLHVKRTVILDSGRQTENEYSLRLYSLHELGQLLNGIGFRVRDVSGRDALPGVFFGQESPNMLIVAERRTGAEGASGANE